VADGVISDRWAPVSPSGTLDAFVWRAPDERIAAVAEPAPIEPAPTPQRPEIPAPPAAPSPAPAAQVIEPPRGSAPSNAPSPPRVGIIVDPGTMAPDDPGPGEPDAERGDFRLYANE
jgi:HemY protein